MKLVSWRNKMRLVTRFVLKSTDIKMLEWVRSKLWAPEIDDEREQSDNCLLRVHWCHFWDDSKFHINKSGDRKSRHGSALFQLAFPATLDAASFWLRWNDLPRVPCRSLGFAMVEERIWENQRCNAFRWLEVITEDRARLSSTGASGASGASVAGFPASCWRSKVCETWKKACRSCKRRSRILSSGLLTHWDVTRSELHRLVWGPLWLQKVHSPVPTIEAQRMQCHVGPGSKDHVIPNFKLWQNNRIMYKQVNTLTLVILSSSEGLQGNKMMSDEES